MATTTYVYTRLNCTAWRTSTRRGAHTRRTNPARVDRHWLVLAVATLWVLAYGTRVEEARLRGLAPVGCGDRPWSLFQLGWSQAQRLLHRGYAWARVWLQPLPGPDPPRELQWVAPPAG